MIDTYNSLINILSESKDEIDQIICPIVLQRIRKNEIAASKNDNDLNICFRNCVLPLIPIAVDAEPNRVRPSLAERIEPADELGGVFCT